MVTGERMRQGRERGPRQASMDGHKGTGGDVESRKNTPDTFGVRRDRLSLS